MAQIGPFTGVANFKFNCEAQARIGKGWPIFLLTFVNKDFTPPPLIIDEKPLRFGGPVRGVTPPPFLKVKNNIV